jgi:hypothetical protein
MTVVATHRTALKWAFELLEMTMADVTQEQAYWLPPGIANPIGATYAHAVCGLDGVFNGLLRGAAPLFASSWAGKTGVSEPQMNSTPEWAHSVRVDLTTARAYAQAAYTNVDAYISGLSETDLARELDLSMVGLGTQTLDWCLSALVTGHLNNMAGEISCLKGIQGAKGYPF